MPGKPKGLPKTGGRQKGTKNKATKAREEILAKTGLTPLEYMLSVLCDPNQETSVRMDAAKGAAPYVHPKLANVELSGKKDAPITIEIVRYSDLAHPQ